MQITVPSEYLASTFVVTLFISLAVVVYYHNRKSWINRFFALFMLVTDAWAVTGAVYFFFPVIVYRWVAIQMICGVCIGPSFYFFARALTSENFRIRWFDWVVTVPSFYVILASLARIFIPEVSADFAAKIQVVDHKLIRQPDFNYYMYTIALFGSILSGLAFIAVKSFKHPDKAEKKQMLTVFISVLAGSVFLLGFNNILNLLGKELQPQYSLYGLTVMIAIIAFTVLRHKAWTIEHLLEIIRKNEEELSLRNQTIESELDLARLVQKKLLPSAPPSVKGFDIDFYYHPMDKVGGDFYDYVFTKNSVSIIMADVSGHGIPGAFLATISKMGFQTFAETSANGSELMMSLDRLISERAVKSMFVTAVYARFLRDTMEMKYTNCGHCFPMIYGASRGDIVELASIGRPLGASFGLEPVEQTVKLQSGDRILLYTDGIVETLNENEEEYGEERLKGFLRDNYRKTTREFSDRLFDSLRVFSGKDERIDDISLTIVDVL